MKYVMRLVGFLAGVAFLVLVTLLALYGLRMPLDDPNQQSAQSGPQSWHYGSFGEGGSVPPEAVERFQPEIDLITQPYAPGQEAPPTMGTLFPKLVDATTKDPQPEDGNYEAEGIGLDGEPTVVVLAAGDAGVKASIYWQCGWAREYFDAETADDADRMDVAADALRQFATLEPITQFAPDLADMSNQIIEPMLNGDDEEQGKAFFQRNCGWPAE